MKMKRTGKQETRAATVVAQPSARILATSRPGHVQHVVNIKCINKTTSSNARYRGRGRGTAEVPERACLQVICSEQERTRARRPLPLHDRMNACFSVEHVHRLEEALWLLCTSECARV